MPTYNNIGDIAFGVDSVVGWIRRGQPARVIASNAGGAVWKNDYSIVYLASARGTSPKYLENSCFLVECGNPYSSPPTECDANSLVGGGDRWGGFRASNPTSVFSSFGFSYLGAGKISMGRKDGTLVMCTNYAQDVGVLALYPDGNYSPWPTEPCANTCCADKHALGWLYEGYTLGAFIDQKFSRIRLPYETYAARMYRRPSDGKVWITYVSGGTPYGVAHTIDDPNVGYLFGVPNPQVLNTDITEINGKLYGCWSTTTGERPEHIHEEMLTNWGPLPRHS